jgi:GNAT superfamily N-acetyltransferase
MPTILPPTPEVLRDTQEAVFRNAGSPGGVQDNLPLAPGPSLEQQADDKVKRQAAAGFTDKVGAMWRQDGIVDGMMSSLAGHQMLPDPKYNQFEPETWKNLTQGISDELIPALYDVRSAPHAEYVRGQLLDKQKEQQVLGDLGAWGTTGRLAFGVVMPDQLLAGMLGGRAAQAVKWAQVARAAKAVKAAGTVGESLSAGAAEAAARAKVLAKEAKTSAVASGALVGGASNAAFEKLRQNFNFEDNSTDVLTAALTGAGLSIPFGLLHLKGQRRIADTAAREAEALEAVRASYHGEDLSPRQHELVKQVSDFNEVVRHIESGRLTAEEAEAALEKLHVSREAESGVPPEGLKTKDGRKFAITRENGAFVARDESGNKIGNIDDHTGIDYEADGMEPITNSVEVHEDWRGQGVGRELYAKSNESSGGKLTPSEMLSDDAERFWRRNNPDALHARIEKTAERVIASARKAGETPEEHIARLEERLTNPGDADQMQRHVMEATLAKLKGEAYEPTWLHKNPEVPGFIPKGSIGSGQASAVTSIAEQRSAFNGSDDPKSKSLPLRMDIFAVLNRSENPLVRKLGFGLVKDAIQVDKFEAQGWTASEWKSHYRRTLAGEFYSQSKEAVREAVKARGLNMYQRISSGFDREFHELVSRVTRGDLSVLKDNPDIAPALRKASAAMRSAYDNMYAEAVAAGVKGIDHITPQDMYVNRQWDHQSIRRAEALHGADAVLQVLAGAIKVPGHTGDLKKAKGFLGAVKKLEFSPVMQDIMLHAQDMGTLRKELRAAGPHMTDGDIDNIVDAMFEAKAKDGGDAGLAANLKYRFDLDENFSIKTKAGDLRISDLLENDSRVLIDTYFNSMAGHTAMAKQGITSKADWDLRMREIGDWYTANSKMADAGKRHQALLNDIYANITGRPMSTQDFSMANRVAGTMRAYTRSVMLGQLGFAAAFEMKQAAALFGTRALFTQMPSLSGILTALRQGHVPNMQLARDISHIAGFGNEMAMSYARHAEVEDGFAGRTFHAVETKANEASHVVDILSGNAGLTAMTRSWSGRMFTQMFSDFAKGSKKLTADWRTRMVGWGINDDDLDDVLAGFKKHTTTGPGGRVESIDYEGWLHDSPKGYEKFQLALTRAARDAVQDHDLGETLPFMHSTLGKVFGELKSFFLVAHAKNMLKNLHYRDATAFQVYMIGLLGEGLAYATQTTANYAAQPDELAKRLTLDSIGRAAFFRMAAAGILPTLLDTGFGVVTGGDSLVQQGTTTNTDNRSLVPASGIMAGRLMGAPKTLGGLLLGTDVTTQKEWRDLAGILPGSRLMGISQGVNAIADLFPKSDPSKGR